MGAKSIRQLFERTLCGDYDADAPWEAVRELQHLGTREVFEIASDWCRSGDPLRRARGVDVLAQLGRTAEHRSNSFPLEAFVVASELVQSEVEIQPLRSAIFALGHLDDPRAVSLIAAHEAHSAAGVRFAVACALGAYPNDAESMAGLLRLMSDADPDVRDWATFGIGVLGDADTPENRDALAARLSDVNQDAREEAVVGLAKRQDRRTLPCLLELLEGPDPSCRVIEAASLMLSGGHDDGELAPSDYVKKLKATVA